MEWCRVFLKGSAGYPRRCKSCAEEYPEEQWRIAEEWDEWGEDDDA